ncbi:MAG: HdeD family acid-resistance protein [Gaiellaceae bacterium]
MSSVAANIEGAAERQLGDVLPPWWLLLITGIGWSVVGLILLRFDYTSVHAISLLFGFVGIAAGVMEIFMVFMVRGWWKLLNGVLAIAFLAAGVTAFVHPGDTFLALAAVFSFFLLFAGMFDIIQSIAARNEVGAWWLQLIGGIIEVALAFWAAGYYGRSSVLLIAWVAAFAIIRGVRDFVFAFRVRELQHA